MTTTTEHRMWAELSPVTQAALRCKDPIFWAFLMEGCLIIKKIEDEETAADAVRSICEVDSRSQLAEDLNAQAIWHTLDNHFRAWLALER